MISKTETHIETAEIISPCLDMGETLDFFIERLGFLIVSIFPADNPSVAVISGYGLRIRLEGGAKDVSASENARIRLNCHSPEKVFGGKRVLVAPNGVKIELAASNPPLPTPDLKPSLRINKFSDDANWIKGRAGMRYRDLLPDRLGGYVIASHIHIPDAGPVPDYVHFHKVQLQMIFCYKGWVRVVYEDQGEPFVLNAGDCVLQPPEIRHRVLECSENLEVIEISLPAEHITYADHELELPTRDLNPQREFGGQKFVRHIAENAAWQAWDIEGFECRDTGMEVATKGLANVKVVRTAGNISEQTLVQDSKFHFIFVLNGSMKFGVGKEDLEMFVSGDSLATTLRNQYTLIDCSDDLELLEVSLA